MEHRVLGCAEAVEQRTVCVAAAQEDVLAVIEHEATALERVRGTAEAGTNLEQRHLHAGVRQVERRRDSGEPAADHNGRALAHGVAPAASLRLRIATQVFSHEGRETRRSRTVSGSRSIRSRMRR